MTACCFAGYRPEKLNIGREQVEAALAAEISAALEDGVTAFITGMARGVDLWAAELVLGFRQNNTSISLLCAVPYQGFESKWPPQWQQMYFHVLDNADYVKIFFPAFTYDSFQVRNRWMVDHADRVVAVFNGERGGTYNTVEYARRQKVEVRIIKG